MVVTGNPIPIEKLKRIRVTPNGREVEVEVEGVKPFVLEMVDYYATASKSCEYEADGAVGRIYATYAGPPAGVTEIPLDRIALRTTEVQQSIFFNDRFRWIPIEVITTIRQQVETVLRQSSSATAYSAATGVIVGACQLKGIVATYPLELFDFLLQGTDSFILFTRNITRTRTVSPKFDTKVSQADVGALFTPEQLATALGGSTLPFQVPTLTLLETDVPLGLVAAWQKSQCDVDDTAGGQRQLIESWRLAKWSADLYPVKA